MGIIIKTPEQIEGIRKSCKLAAQCLEFIRPHIKVGVTTASLDNLIDNFIREHNAISACLNYVMPIQKGQKETPVPFPKATCISLNEVICHGVPSDKVVLKRGDILNIDVTTILDGYFGDTSTMFIVPPISLEAQYLVAVAKQCLDVGIKQVRPGNRFGNIGYEIGRYARMYGVSVNTQMSGHGVGIAFHEEPQILHEAEKDSGEIMEVGQIFTCEPMINLGVADGVLDRNDRWTIRTADGRLSAQYEHTILVTNDGHEVLT